jgi:hypothetical protein
MEEKKPLLPAAPDLTLLRRAHFDLTGLPPSPEDVEAFDRDKDPGRYENLVDRLLKPYAEYDLLKARIDLVREGEKGNNRRHEFGEGIQWIATVDLQACATARETEPEAACVASAAAPTP